MLAEDPAWARARERVFGEHVRDVSEVLDGEIGESRAARHPIKGRGSSITTRVTWRTRRASARSRGRAAGRRSRASSCCRRRSRRSAAAAPASTISYSRSRRAQLGERKARNIAALKPDIIATGNPGCILQIAAARPAAAARSRSAIRSRILAASIRRSCRSSSAVRSRTMSVAPIIDGPNTEPVDHDQTTAVVARRDETCDCERPQRILQAAYLREIAGASQDASPVAPCIAASDDCQRPNCSRVAHVSPTKTSPNACARSPPLWRLAFATTSEAQVHSRAAVRRRRAAVVRPYYRPFYCSAF